MCSNLLPRFPIKNRLVYVSPVLFFKLNINLCLQKFWVMNIEICFVFKLSENSVAFKNKEIFNRCLRGCVVKTTFNKNLNVNLNIKQIHTRNSTDLCININMNIYYMTLTFMYKLLTYNIKYF